ncbi:hypothetical protein [Peribacillus sp. R9-11]|uniref:hypothetical protein n=1 Tax=Peribacillus sp. R9-11 TaxID=3073271 RepID=UPI002868432D|nr:hypothetical protein [Peribacillus sp. R9-11]WMX54655.1 hypothetical protein RE409_21705 [Peribacillus sp. R9-11]
MDSKRKGSQRRYVGIKDLMVRIKNVINKGTIKTPGGNKDGSKIPNREVSV